VTLTAFGPGRTLVIGYSSGDVHLWDTAKFRDIATLTGPPSGADTAGVSSLAVGTGGTLAVGAANCNVYLWHVKSWNLPDSR
jgi:WD40 repeat protein